MTDQWAELCRLWSESGREGSPWRPGMRLLEITGLMGGVLVCVYPHADESLLVYTDAGQLRQWYPEDARPDLTDLATLGCLLGLVREIWGDESMHCRCYAEYHSHPSLDRLAWQLFCGTSAGLVGSSRPTEGEALLAAAIAGLTHRQEMK